MLPKHQRLNLKTDFSRVVKGKRVESPHFIFYFSDGVGDFTRVGISIRTKSFGKAHNRNRARRITSQAIQNRYKDLSKKLDLIIMPKSGVQEIPVKLLEMEVSDVLARHQGY